MVTSPASVRASARIRTLVFALLLTLPLPGSPSGAAPSPDSAAGEGTTGGKLPAALGHAAEVHFTDGSVLKLKVLEERFTLTTPYGKLVVPFADVNEIEFATRTPDDVARLVARAIGELASSEFKKRDAATAELARLQVKAYPGLLEAEKSKDAEVQRRAKLLLDKIRKAVSEENLEVRARDVVHTNDSKITGRLEALVFRAETVQFGEVRLRLSDMRSLRSLAYQPAEKPEGVLPNPGSLAMYQGQVGKTLFFQVTGAVAGGSVWGSNTYTLDSSLAMAAVHAGVLKAGQAGIIKVKLLGPTNNFQGATRNGVTSMAYANYPGAYEFIKKK